MSVTYLSPTARADLALRMAEAAVEMHRDNGDLRAARAAQARVNGLRVKRNRLRNATTALAAKLEVA